MLYQRYLHYVDSHCRQERGDLQDDLTSGATGSAPAPSVRSTRRLLGSRADDIARLRALHMEIDHAVADTYDWDDLDLGHGLHDTAQGVRYTIHPAARDEVLDRLLQLNQERYEEEVRAGLWEGKGQKGKSFWS